MKSKMCIGYVKRMIVYYWLVVKAHSKNNMYTVYQICNRKNRRFVSFCVLTILPLKTAVFRYVQRGLASHTVRFLAYPSVITHI